MKAIDLFAGAGGFSTGAAMAGCDVVWAANHWPEAVHWHAANHPDAEHVCQDLHQARWEDVPAHDLMLASPCCQGHSKARGKAHGNPQHDASRSTAWAVVSAAEYHRPELIVVENVPEFLDWQLYRPWEHGDTFLISYYGNTMTGRSLDRPIGTITTRDRWAIVHGDSMRMLTRFECRDAMSFPADYQLPDNHRLAVHLMGNAVCPVPVSRLIRELKEAA